MKITAYEMQYYKETVEETNLVCVPFERKYFEEYMRIYNECFYPMRKSLERKPYNFLSEYEQIEEKTADIYLVLNEGEMIGSIACYDNEIDDFIINQKYQGMGYGRKLLLWGMRKIRSRSKAPITLHVAKWNKHALSLYKKMGFEVVNEITV